MASKDLEPQWGELALEEMTFSEMMEAGVVDISEIDDVVAVDQAELVGVSFLLYDWDVKQSQTFGGTYAVCRVKTLAGTRVFADGGVGIQEALDRYSRLRAKKGIAGPMYFHFGLRASTYTTEVDGKPTQATTYYFDNRPRP